MREIVNRLKENRDIERAKQLMESAGYKVSKRSDEAFVSGIGHVDPMTLKRWREQEEEWEREHPDEFKDMTMTPEDLKAQGAVQASEVKAGDTIQADFVADEIDTGEFYTVKSVSDDGEGMGDITFICDDGTKLHYDKDEFIGFKVDPKDIPDMKKSRAEYDLKSYESKELKESASWTDWEKPYGSEGRFMMYQYSDDIQAEIYEPGEYGGDQYDTYNVVVLDFSTKFEEVESADFPTVEEAKAWAEKKISEYVKSKELDAPARNESGPDQIAYAKELLRKAKSSGDVDVAWELVDFLWDTELLK